MADEHLSEELVVRFLGERVGREERNQVIRHLLTGCQTCATLVQSHVPDCFVTKAGQVLQAAQGDAGDWNYDEVFDSVLQLAEENDLAAAREKIRGWGLWTDLALLPSGMRRVIVRENARFRSRALFDRLVEIGRSSSREHPAHGVEVAYLALAVAEDLVAAFPEHGELRAKAFAELGNAKRLASDFAGAAEALQEARQALLPEDRRGLANLMSLEASLSRNVGEFEEALETLNGVLAIFQDLEDHHGQGRTLLKMSDAIGHVDPHRGIHLLKQALTFIDVESEPRLELCAQHDLAWFLTDAGRVDEGLTVLEVARPLYRQFQDPYVQLRLHWLEGRIAYRLGDLPEAESIFKHLASDFAATDCHHEQVLVSIDLAQVYAARGDARSAAELTASLLPLLRAWGLHREGLAVWLLFSNQLGQAKVADEAFTAIVNYFRSHWFRPKEYGGGE